MSVITRYLSFNKLKCIIQVKLEYCKDTYHEYDFLSCMVIKTEIGITETITLESSRSDTNCSRALAQLKGLPLRMLQIDNFSVPVCPYTAKYTIRHP